MSDLVDEEYDAERNSSQKENSKSKSSTTMFLYLREFIFLFALALTSYTALFNSLPKVGKAPTPLPFFQKNSFVVDYYKGNVNAAFQKASAVDLTLVMYYAPWDADSQAARKEFESAAEFLHEEVFFTAISCWAPSSECKQHVPRIRHFPVIVAYPQHGKGIHYQGPLESVYIIHFVKTIMRPIKRILSPSDIINLISTHGALVVGSFLFSGNLGGPGYHTFYSTALKMLEKDPFQEIAFVVTTDMNVAATLEIESVPSIRLYLWNETYDYPSEDEYTEELLAKWIRQKTYQVVQWISPPKMKSQILSPHIADGPALILFTPRNPLFDVNPMFSMLKEIAYRYHNCNNNVWVQQLANFIAVKNHYLKNSAHKLEKYCQARKRKKKSFNLPIEMPSVIVPTSFFNSTESLERDVCHAGSIYSSYLGPQSEICYKKSKTNNVFLNGFKHTEGYDSTFFENEDSKSSEILFEKWEDEKCENHEIANEYLKLPYPNVTNSRMNETIDGLSCFNNRTLSIIAMDSLSHYQFAEGFGINILNVKEKTSVVIIDKKEESQFILNEEITKESLISFIVKHTRNELNRSLRSSHDSYSRSVSRHRYPVRKSENCTHAKTESCVPELNSKNFMDFVMSRGEAAIIFYHTPYCALCRSISHLFLLLSRYFKHFPGLKFARIDGENNDLPWEYTMDLFPTILFFPTMDKSESRLYSNNLPFTIKNLINFVLANLEPEAKIPAMISLCISFENLQDENEARKCKSKIQKQSHDYLSATLISLRKVMNRWKNLSPKSRMAAEIRGKKQLLINKLDYFKTIHFLLGSIQKIQGKSTVVTDILKLYVKFLRFVKTNIFCLNCDGYR